jgi:hypothetical protein
MSNLSKPQLRDSMLESAPQYYSNYRYHNYEGHVTQSMEDFVSLRDWLAQKGIPIDKDLGLISLAYHDANFHLDEKQAGFDTKEKYSAWLAHKDLRELGASDHIIRTVSGAIIKTTFNEIPETNLEKAIRLADVGNVTGDPKVFLYNTYLLMAETIQRGLPLPDTFEQFCVNSQNFLGYYYDKPLEFRYRNKLVLYEPMTGQARRNIRTLGKMTLGPFINLMSGMVPKIEDTIPEIWKK